MVIVNKIEGVLKENNGHNHINKLRVFTEDKEEMIVAKMVSDFLQSDKKINMQIYNTFDIEDENRQLLNAILYSNDIDAGKFEGSLEIFEIK